MLNNNTIANKKDANARAKYVGGDVDWLFILFFYLHINFYEILYFTCL